MKAKLSVACAFALTIITITVLMYSRDKASVKVEEKPNNIVVEIDVNDETYLDQLDMIIRDPEASKGKVIRIDGMLNWDYDGGEVAYRYLYRRVLPDDYLDDIAKIEIKWDGLFPEADTWINVVGTLDWYTEGGENFAVIYVDNFIEIPAKETEYTDWVDETIRRRFTKESIVN